jgi:hypothetical protein
MSMSNARIKIPQMGPMFCPKAIFGGLCDPSDSPILPPRI